MERPFSAPKDISGMSDSKLKSTTGIKTIVMSAKYLETTNFTDDIRLQYISSAVLPVRSFSHINTTTNTGYKPNDNPI